MCPKGRVTLGAMFTRTLDAAHSFSEVMLTPKLPTPLNKSVSMLGNVGLFGYLNRREHGTRLIVAKST